MENTLYNKLIDSPIIAALKDTKKLDLALASTSSIIFLLSGNIMNIGEIVDKAKSAGKEIYIHVDLIEGFSRDAAAIRYIGGTIKPSGIISTKSNLIKIATELGIPTVQRFFIIDSLSLHTSIKSARSLEPCAIEIMPGVMPKILSKIKNEIEIPLIAGGLINEKEDVIAALAAGAVGVSTTNSGIWEM